MMFVRGRECERNSSPAGLTQYLCKGIFLRYNLTLGCKWYFKEANLGFRNNACDYIIRIA